MKKRVAVALSGGVDSSFTAYLLKTQGYEVIGLYMDLGLGKVEEARKVADFLSIPFYVLNFKEEFEKRVITYFINSYQEGKTPNPCVVCNQWIKFGLLLQKAIELDAQKLCTGHYARISREKQGWTLQRGREEEKDQSYFLFPLLEKPLGKISFPLGDFRKQEIIKEARRAGLPAHHRESQEVCFLDRGGIKSFLQRKLKGCYKPGPIITKEGKRVGTHSGICFYTIGQRRGMHLTLGEPYYVVKIIPEENTVVVGKREEVYSQKLLAKRVIWAKYYKPEEGKILHARIRYQHRDSPAQIISWDGENLILQFLQPQWAITPGQATVFYEKDKVIGGGWIEKVLND